MPRFNRGADDRLRPDQRSRGLRSRGCRARATPFRTTDETRDATGRRRSLAGACAGRRRFPQRSRTIVRPRPAEAGAYNGTLRKRSALTMTETELNVMAALAIIGLSNKPMNG